MRPLDTVEYDTAWDLGYQAFKRKDKRNPFTLPQFREAWQDGWNEARDEYVDRLIPADGRDIDFVDSPWWWLEEEAE